MTTIKMENEDDLLYRVEISGHNEPYICNAVSMLSFTLLNILSRLREQQKISLDRVSMTDGDIRIKFSVAPEAKQDVRARMDSIAEGFWTLKEGYPEMIQLSVYSL